MIDNIFLPSSQVWRDDYRGSLEELPDTILEDIGITRSEIPFAVRALESRHRTMPRDGGSRLLLRKAMRAVFRNVQAAMRALSLFVAGERPRLVQPVRFSSARDGNRKINEWP